LLEELFDKVKSRVGIQTEPKTPEETTWKCTRCGTVLHIDDFTMAGKVCTSCNYHARLTARERLELTCDPGTFKEYDAGMKSKNPIDFPGYPEKLKTLKKATGIEEAMLTGECRIENMPCVIGVMDTNFMMASMGSVVGEKITRAFERAQEKRLPVILFTASGGARMQEGVVSLMQMAKTSGAVARHSDAGLLYLTVLTDPTTGGVAASFAALGDIILAEPKALIGFAGRRVIEGTIKQKLPDDFQSAEFFLEHGFVDLLAERKAMRKTLGRLLRFHEDSGREAF
jgi:acetyl-CoA carboxylase carboxyl transferase subunit beta